MGKPAEKLNFLTPNWTVMCGRTSLFQPQPEIEQRFDAKFEQEYEPRYNIAPGDDLVVIHNDDPETLTFDEWGFVPTWADDFNAGPRPINARAETVAENNLFQASFEQRRALVVADGFYEWEGTRGGTQPYRITMDDNDLFAMAGIWSQWKEDAQTQSTVAILTTEPNDVMEPIHDRMPVILEPNEESTWLDPPSLTEATQVLDPHQGEMKAQPISTIVNDPANDSPAVVEPIVGDSGQTGLGNFGAD